MRSSIHILSNDGPRTADVRNRDVDTLFESLLLADAELNAKSGQMHSQNLIIRRWVIQATAIDPSLAWKGRVEERIQAIQDHDGNHLPKCDVLLAQVAAVAGFDEGLCNRLNTLSAYGGDKTVELFADCMKFADSEKNILQRFEKVWASRNGADRMAFVHDLWATSGTFGSQGMLVANASVSSAAPKCPSGSPEEATTS